MLLKLDWSSPVSSSKLSTMVSTMAIAFCPMRHKFVGWLCQLSTSGTERSQNLSFSSLFTHKKTLSGVICMPIAFWIGILFSHIVYSKRYYNFLTMRFISDGYHEYWIQDIGFQQDGAPRHSTGRVLGLPKSHYNNHVIGRGFPNHFEVLWISYCPHVLPLECLLWGILEIKSPEIAWKP